MFNFLVNWSLVFASGMYANNPAENNITKWFVYVNRDAGFKSLGKVKILSFIYSFKDIQGYEVNLWRQSQLFFLTFFRREEFCLENQNKIVRNLF